VGTERRLGDASRRLVQEWPFPAHQNYGMEHAKLDPITLRHWFSRYSECLLAPMFQTAVCHATHTITQRTAEQGVIATRRGIFVVLHEAALRQQARGCTTAIGDHFDTVLHGIYRRADTRGFDIISAVNPRSCPGLQTDPDRHDRHKRLVQKSQRQSYHLCT
jgi:hypothetical protein